jgi:type VI protein secretion system component Hcp
MKARYALASLLVMALASAWSAAAQAQSPIHIVLTSPDIQSGAQVALVEFSGSLARRGEPGFDGARACGLNKIVKSVDTSSSPQFIAALFNRVQLSAASIASILQNAGLSAVYYQVDLTGVAVDEITRTAPPPASLNGLNGNGGLVTETITLHATTVKYTYQPILQNGQKNGPPVTFGWNCTTNTAFGGS